MERRRSWVDERRLRSSSTVPSAKPTPFLVTTPQHPVVYTCDRLLAIMLLANGHMTTLNLLGHSLGCSKPSGAAVLPLIDISYIESMRQLPCVICC
jgi:hypothetical protein